MCGFGQLAVRPDVAILELHLRCRLPAGGIAPLKWAGTDEAATLWVFLAFPAKSVPAKAR